MSSTSTAGLTVLVVEDSALMRRMVGKAVATSGHPIAQVLEAEQGREALAFLRRERVDVVLVDLQLPVMDGVQLVEAMTKDPALAALPIIVVSAERNEARLTYLRRLGVRAIVAKPFKTEEIKEALDGVFAASAAAHP